MKRILFTFLIMFVGVGMAFSQIQVTSPNGGESWAKTTTHNVTWNTGGVAGNVIIQVFQGGASQGAIYNGANTGSFSWTIDNYLSASPIAPGAYKLQVKSLSDPSIKDQSNANFDVTGPASSQITVSSPNGGENWEKNSSHNVTWTSSGVSGNVIIQIFQGGVSQGAIYNGANTGSFSWTIDNYLSASPVALGAYKLQVKSLNDSSIKDQSNNDFNVVAESSGPSSSPSCLPFQVYEPVYNSSHWIGFNMAIKWKNKMVVMKKIAYPLAKVKVAKIVKPDLGLTKIKMVKIEIKSVKCFSILQFKDKLKTLYLKEKVPMQKIDFLMKMPWVFELLKWKPIATTVDDGSYIWKVPFSYKKGCYVIRVTKLWCSASDSDRVAVSKSFKLVPLVIGPIQMEIFKKKSAAVEILQEKK